MRRIAIFIPAYNEEKSIGTVVLLAKMHGKVFVVDDGSTDSTGEVARRAGAKVIRRQKNGGYGAALRTALAAARKEGADASVFMDGDFQHHPSEIPIVAAPVLEGKADVSLGSRFLGKFVSAHAGRKEGVMLLNALSGMQNGKKGVDSQCGFRAFSKKAVREVEVADKGYAACSEAIVRAQSRGLRLVEVPVHVRYYDGMSGSALAQGAGLLGHLMAQISRRRPDLMLLGGGIACIALSFFVGLFVVETMYGKGVLAVGSALLTVFFGLAGIFMVMFGLTLNALERLRRRD